MPAITSSAQPRAPGPPSPVVFGSGTASPPWPYAFHGWTGAPRATTGQVSPARLRPAPSHGIRPAHRCWHEHRSTCDGRAACARGSGYAARAACCPDRNPAQPAAGARSTGGRRTWPTCTSARRCPALPVMPFAVAGAAAPSAAGIPQSCRHLRRPTSKEHLRLGRRVAASMAAVTGPACTCSLRQRSAGEANPQPGCLSPQPATIMPAPRCQTACSTGPRWLRHRRACRRAAPPRCFARACPAARGGVRHRPTGEHRPDVPRRSRVRETPPQGVARRGRRCRCRGGGDRGARAEARWDRSPPPPPPISRPERRR